MTAGRPAGRGGRTQPKAPRSRAQLTSTGKRLHWWAEVLAIAGFYVVYSFVRNANEGSTSAAFANARELMRWQRYLGLNVEATLQDWALHFEPLVVVMNYLYGSLHFVVTAGVIVYLFRRYPGDYPRWRNALAATTALALVGFILWPLMPPRLLPARYGFVDTLARYPTIWSFDSGTLQRVSNQYAAMPSLHFAWALFCTCALVPRLRRPVWRWAAMAYPAVTLAAIVLTGNHFLLDAAGGAAVFGAGCALAWRFTPAPDRVSDPRPVPPERW